MISLQDERVKSYLTPYRCPVPVLHGSGQPGSFDSQTVDCPFVFFHNGIYHMLYIGFDGIGYQTALAMSQDLLHWRTKGIVIKRDREGNRWDHVGGAGIWLIKESDSIWEVPRLRKIDGKYWMVYHVYPKTGYESGPGEIALAWTRMRSFSTGIFRMCPSFRGRMGKNGSVGVCISLVLWKKMGTFPCFTMRW